LTCADDTHTRAGPVQPAAGAETRQTGSNRKAPYPVEEVDGAREALGPGTGSPNDFEGGAACP